MTSKERIKKTLEFKMPDRVGIHDSIPPETISSWYAQGYPRLCPPEEYFDFDFRLFDLEDERFEEKVKSDANKDKFLTLSFSDPFESISRRIGRLSFLKEFAKNPRLASLHLNQELECILESLQKRLNSGLVFDGAWVWSDLAYNEGLFFSTGDYKKLLFPIHKRLFSYLNSKGFPVIFHSDGKVNDLIPYLVEAGIRVLHPLECGAGMDIFEVSRRFGRDLVFFGNIDTRRIDNKDEMKKEVINKLKVIHNGIFYMYHASSPISSDIYLDKYAFLLENVRRYGGYVC